MIKAFLFDYDGVITPGADVKLPAKLLARNIGISEDKTNNALINIWHDLSTGKLSDTEIWQQLEGQIGQAIPENSRNIWHTWKELTPLPYMLEFVRELKSMDYPVGLVSNVYEQTAKIIKANGGYNDFDFTILSCQVGTSKPEQEIYSLALEHLPGIEPDEVVFLDDRERSLTGAKEFGFQTIHVSDHQAAINQVRRLIANP